MGKSVVVAERLGPFGTETEWGGGAEDACGLEVKWNRDCWRF